LKNTLKLATFVANQARTVIKKCETNIDFNKYSEGEKLDLHDKIQLMRLKTGIVLYKSFQDVKTMAEVTRKHGYGNCGEYAALTMDTLKNIEPGLRVEIFFEAGGNHGFVVIDREKSSDPLNPSTWGDDAVICDAWSGEVYPAIEGLWRLRSCNNFVFPNKDRYNHIPSYNPRCHVLTSLVDVQASSSTPFESAESKKILMR
jgi:hypothetical protein